MVIKKRGVGGLSENSFKNIVSQRKMIHQTVEALMVLKRKIAEQRATLNQLRSEEKALMKEIQNYLNQTEENGIKLDDDTVITVSSNERKINRTAKQYKTALSELLAARGILDESLTEEILKAKVEQTVQQQKLKISTPKK